MTWSSPRTWAYGELTTEALMNQEVRDNQLYLHGDAGTIVLAAGVVIPNAAAYYAKNVAGTAKLLASLGNDDVLRMYVAGGNALAILNEAGAAALLQITNAGAVEVYNGLTVDGVIVEGASARRHVMHLQANDVHMESGTVATSGAGDTAVSFSHTFTSTPKIVGSCQDAGQSYASDIVSPSTTGFSASIWNAANSRAAKTMHWIAIGAGS
jgi:hypothetical protein